MNWFYEKQEYQRAKAVSAVVEPVVQVPVPTPVILRLTGRLVSLATTPPCGYAQYGAVAKYTHLKISEGKYPRSEIYIVHGCPEMPRAEYSGDSGGLERFVIGEYHNLTVSNANFRQIGSVVGEPGIPGVGIYFCKTVGLRDADK